MNAVLIPIAAFLLIVLVFILKSIPKKEKKHVVKIKTLISLLFIAIYIFIWNILPAA